MGRGIDYGMGATNIDKDNGIRYGVIPQNEVLQAWCDSSEADYGEPTCPKCGSEADDINADGVPDMDGEHEWDDDGRDYACLHCEYTFDSDAAYGEEPLCHYIGTVNDQGQLQPDSEGYMATQSGGDGDIFVLRSPYYTRAAFCSPCAPGACYLLSPCDDGEKAYCFGHDWYEDGRAPYPVYRVADDTVVEPE